MAEFNFEDPKELENLIAKVPVKQGYTQSVAKPGQELGKYDQGVTMFTTSHQQRELNYANQTGWQAWGNALGQSLAEVTAGTLEGFGYLLDFEQHAKALYGAEQEFDNWFSQSMRQFKDSVREEMPVFTDPDKPFDPLNSRWWASNLPSITSTLSMMIPTGAAVGAIGKLGKVGRILSSDAKLLGGLTSARAITSGAVSRVLESTMEAAGNADQVYKKLIEEGTDEETARTEAGKVASNTYYANLPLVLGDIFEYSVLFKNKGVNEALEAFQKQQKKSLLKSSLQIGSTMLSEGGEEAYQYVAGKEAEKSKNASETMSNIFSNFSEYFDDPEFLSSVVVGGVAGGGFQALGNFIESRSSKLGEQLPNLDLPELKPIFQNIATQTGKTANDIRVAATQAYQLFKDNLQEAVINTEEAVKSLPEGHRETVKLGLEVLKQINIKEIGTQDVPTAVNNYWNKAKDVLKGGLDRLKSLAGFNEKIQQAEAAGNKVEVEILSRSKFEELIKTNPAKAEQFLADAQQDEGIDPTIVKDYEEILNTYKQSTVQHKGNEAAVFAEVQAEIRRQTIAKLTQEAITEGSKYKDFDLYQIREQYLDNIDSPEAKSLKQGLEIDKTRNKTVPKKLKNLIEHLTQKEIEEVKLTKEADYLNTKKGQEELAIKQRQEQLDNIKSTTDPEVLFQTYNDEELDNAVKERKNKLFKEEIKNLPDPNDFFDYDSFKEAVTSEKYPVIGSSKDTAKIDKQLIDYYNKGKRVEEVKPIEVEETEFEKTLPDTPFVEETEDKSSPLEIDSELPDYNSLNEEIAQVEPFGDFMLHSQLWDMASPTKQWGDRQFIKDSNGNNKRPSAGFTDWTDNLELTEQFFMNIGDPKSHTLYFEAQNVQFKERRGKIPETTKDNVSIRVYTIFNNQKVYVGQLQRTSQTVDKEKTNTAALDELRTKAFEWYKTSKVGEKFTLGETKITNYNNGFFNVLAKPRPVTSALTQEEKDNIGIGVYMGENEELGAMKTNRPDMVDIKPGKASPGSVFIAKKVPSGEWRWFGARTKKLGQMDNLIQEVRDILQPFVNASRDGKNSDAYKYIARSEFISATLARLRSIVRYKVDGKLEPDFNEKIINVKIYQTDGVFDIDKFISVNQLLDRPVQIDPKQLNDQNYIDSILDRLETDIDIVPFANPFFAVAPLDNVQLDQVEKTIDEPVVEDLDFDIDIDDSPKFLRTTVDNSRKINPEQAVKNLRKIIPNVYTVKVVEGLIKSGDAEAYGMAHDAAVTLSDLAPEGTEFHEAYHVVESILPEWQKKYVQRFGTEEDRAEAFRDYMLTKQVKKSELRKLFDNIIAFIKDLLKFNVDILEIFERIDSGYYKNWKPTYLSKRFMMAGWTAKQKDDLVNLYVAHVGNQIDYAVKENVEGMINSDPAWNRMTSLAAKSPLHLFIAKVYKQAGLEKANEILQSIRKDAEIKVVDGKLKLTQGTPTFGVLYPELLKALGKRGYKIVLGKLELRELHQTESEQEDLETNTLEGWQDSASLRSPMEKLSKRMKQLIYSIESDKQDSIGLGMNLNYNGYEAYAKLASVIVDSIDVEDMKQRLSTRQETFFKNLVTYINTKFTDSENQWTELYKALGDKTQPEYWVLVESKSVDENGSSNWNYKLVEANQDSIKSRIRNLTVDFKGTPREFLELAGLEDINLTDSELETLGKHLKHQYAKTKVWDYLKDKVSSNFVNAHLNVEGKRQYEIINGGFFSKLLQRLNRDFKNTVANIYSQDPTLSKLPILQKYGKPRDFKFIQFAGFKSHSGEGAMYNNYDERQFVLSTYWAWKHQNIFAMPILSDSPNLVGVRYEVDKTMNMASEIAKLVHLEVKRSKNNFGIKNYKPEVRTIWGDIEYNEDLTKQELIVSQYFDNQVENFQTYSSSVRAYLPSDTKELKQYLMEHAFVHTQMAMLSIGDLAFYKNLEDYYKRAKEIWSPVIKGNVENYFKNGEEKIKVVSKRQRVKVLPSQEVPSNQIDDLEKINGIPGKEYRKVDKTDAQTEIDLIAYRDRMITLNEWTKEHNDAFEYLVKGEFPPNDITGLFNVLKPFYYNLRTVRQENEDGSTESIVVPTQKKDSEMLILPVYGLETINGQPNLLYNPLWRQHLIEMGYNFDTMSYDMQGREEGKYYDVITYDTTIKVGKTDELYFNLSDWGKQQETPEHHYMSDAIFGTQLMKLITGNLEGNYIVNNESISGKELWTRYNNLVTEWISENYKNLIKEYGSLDKIKKMAIEDMINKGMRDDYIKSIEILPITHPIHFNKIVQVINSFAKSNVTDLTFKSGFTFANASSEGFTKQPRIVWNKNAEGIEDPNLGIDHFQVYAPVHDKRVKDYMVDGVVDMKALQEAIDTKKIPNLLEGLVYRIPTESKYSMFKIKIVGFLPVDNGVIFMPDMVTKIAGLDFDIDKVRGFFYGGNTLQDKILELMMSVLSSPTSLKEQLTPGGFDNLKDNNLYIRGYKAGIVETDELIKTEAGKKKLTDLLKDKFQFFSPITLSKIARRMNVGKALIGTAANTNAVHSLMEAYTNFTGNEIKDKQVIVYEGNTVLGLSRKYDVEGTLISSNIAELLAAFVDNGKDPQAEYSNISSDTIAVGLYLLKRGLPLKTVQMFLTQVTDPFAPKIKGFVPHFSNNDLIDGLKEGNSEDFYNTTFAAIRLVARKLEDFVGAVKVANQGAGATMVDNYMKLKKLKEDPYYDMLKETHDLLENKEVQETNLTTALINKGLVEWNRYIVNNFGIPDVEKGTIGKALTIMLDSVTDRMTEDDVKNLYNSFLTYIGSAHFKYDAKLVEELHAKINDYKLANPDNKFLQRLKLVNGFIQFTGSNTNDELEIQSIIDNWTELLKSENTKKIAEDLVKYAFYTKGFDFGMGSFGHLIPLYYYEQHPEFTEMYTSKIKELDQANETVAKSFIEQYIMNNYYTVKLLEVEGKVEGDLLKVPADPSTRAGYRAEYIRGNNGRIYKYADENTYQEIGTYAKYHDKTKYLQRYYFGTKPIETKVVKTEKKYDPVQESVSLSENQMTDQFTQADVDKINEILEGTRFTKRYTLQEMNNLEDKAKEKVKQCLLTGIIPS